MAFTYATLAVQNRQAQLGSAVSAFRRAYLAAVSSNLLRPECLDAAPRLSDHLYFILVHAATHGDVAVGNPMWMIDNV